MGEYCKFYNSEEKKLELRLGPPGEFVGSVHGEKQYCNGGAGDTNSSIHCSTTSSYVPGAPLKRVAASTVVGWPPIRAFRKNVLSISHSKQQTDPSRQNKTREAERSTANKVNQSSTNDLFIKINMEGVPIGRKINLKAYDSYHSLSLAIHDLFKDLLAAQKGGYGDNNVKENEPKKSTGENGEYTLVYEDCEGDRILVGDVPWNMFVGTAKRLRVLKSSGLSMSQREQLGPEVDGR